MEFIHLADFAAPFPSGVITQSSRLLETVLVGLAPGTHSPVPGGAGKEMERIFAQLDEILSGQGVDRTAVASVRLYLQNINEDIGDVNAAYSAYFGDHQPCRRAYGVELQLGMRVEVAFVAELPAA